MHSISQRKEALNKLLKTILEHEEEIHEALYKDFKKPAFESIISETGYVINDLKNTLKKIESWAKPQRVSTSLLNFPSSDRIIKEPYGKVLIISPWNYPFQLTMSPLIAAIAAGNTVTIKPSELSPYTSAVVSKIIRESFDYRHAVVVTGNADMAQELLKKRWDYIFFTGSTYVGKIVAKAAAEHLTPVTLELGGKNPCIIDETANLSLAAKRIVWGKFLNAGQTCIAPDYLVVHYRIKKQIVPLLIQEIKNAYGENPIESPDFARIINIKNWRRQISLIENQFLLYGGEHKEEELYMAPTLVDAPMLDSKIMEEEIFGPILPIITYENEDQLHRILTRNEKPLATYIFSTNHIFQDKVVQKYSFGGGCINDTMVHFANKNLPFGGVGYSGMGAYHGKLGFDSFSHKKAILKKANWLDIKLRYAPYQGKEKLLKRILKWL